MSNDFSSSLGLAEMLREYQQEEQRVEQGIPEDEQTPLVSSKSVRPMLNMTLLLTIIVVTIGSSFQFGYATGKLTSLLLLLFSRIPNLMILGRFRRHEQFGNLYCQLLSQSRQGIHVDAMGNDRLLLWCRWAHWGRLGP